MKPRRREFIPWRRAKSDNARALTRHIIQSIADYEILNNSRKRKRKAKDQQSFEIIVEALVMDALHCQLMGTHAGVHLPFSKRNLGVKCRYRSPVLSQMLPIIARTLATDSMKYLNLTIGSYYAAGGAQQTSLSAGPLLIRLMGTYNVTLKDIGVSLGQEPIELKAPKTHPRAKYAELTDYEDTDATELFRGQMRIINQGLHDADIEFDSSNCYPPMETLVDTSDRFLRRIFSNGSFDTGGRLYEGFWYPLKKEQRLQGLQINDEKVVELDFGQAGLRIAYGIAGKEPPSGDLYSIPGWEPYREGFKKLIAAMLGCDRQLNKKPKGTASLLPPSLSISSLQEIVREKHDQISDLFSVGIGHRIQRIESDILIDILLGLHEKDIVALPVHDALLVPLSAASITERVMAEKFVRHTGVQATVSVTTGYCS